MVSNLITNMITKTFDITGMHCASCAHIIESQLHKQRGVAKVQANFGTEKATITFDESMTQVNDANDTIIDGHDHQQFHIFRIWGGLQGDKIEQRMYLQLRT